MGIVTSSLPDYTAKDTANIAAIPVWIGEDEDG
jgi:hypothetical protein